MSRFTAEATVVRTEVASEGGWRGRRVTLLVAAVGLVEDFFARGRLADGPRAAQFLAALGIRHTSPSPSDYRGRVEVELETAPARLDGPPTVVMYHPVEGAPYSETVDPAVALDIVSGDRRRRRPEAMAAARRAAKRLGADGQVHHDVPRRAGGDDRPGNLVPLGAADHAAEEARRRAAERAVPFGLHVAEIVGRRFVPDGEALELIVGGVRIFARSPVRCLGPLRAPRAAVLLEPDGGRRFRFRVADAAAVEDVERIDAMRGQLRGGRER